MPRKFFGVGNTTPAIALSVVQGFAVMRLGLSILALSAVLFAGHSVLAQGPVDVTTGPDAILCLDPQNVAVANRREVSNSQIVLRAMGCLRAEAGIRSRLLEDSGKTGPVPVRFYPAGISAGLVLWGLPSAFMAPDRATIDPATQHKGI